MGGSLEGAKCSEKYSVAVIERVDRGTGSSASRSHDSRFAFFWPESGRSYENCVRSGLVSGRPQSGHALAVGGTWLPQPKQSRDFRNHLRPKTMTAVADATPLGIVHQANG